MIPDGPLLWYVNRATGLVLVVLLTATVLLGVWSTRGAAGARVPRFVVQALHRNIGLLSAVLLALHVATAVLDEYVDIRWWQAFLPWSLDYRPGWLAAGIVALDLIAAVLLTSLVRDWLGSRAWRVVHLSSYAVWAASVAHGLGLGTDSGAGWVRWTYAACALLVAGSVALRVHGALRRRTVPALRTLSGVGGPR